jgi:hypothetical protein
MGLVAFAMPAGVENDKLAICFQRIDVTEIGPVCAASEREVVKDEWWAAADGLIVNANTMTGYKWHDRYLGRVQRILSRRIAIRRANLVPGEFTAQQNVYDRDHEPRRRLGRLAQSVL